MVAEWSEGLLIDVCKEIYRYPSFYGMEKYTVGIPVIRGEHLFPGGIISTDWSDYWFVSSDYAKGFPKTSLKLGDIVMSVRGSIGTFARVGPSHVGAQISPNLIRLSPDPKYVDPGYFYYALCGSSALDFIKSTSSSSAVPAIRAADIKIARIPLPPLAEQRAIAHILGSLDDKIELNRQMNQTLEEMARAIFKSWFVDFDPVHAKARGEQPVGMDTATAALFPATFEDTELGPVPRGWEYTTIDSVYNIFDSKRIPLSSLERAQIPGNYPYYGAASVMDHINDFIFDGIFLLVAEDGSVVTDDNKPVLQYVWGQFWVNNHAHILQGKNGVATEHLYFAFQNTNISPYITGAVQMKLSQRNMKLIPFLLAPEAVNRAFGNLIEPLFSAYRGNIDESRTLAELRDTLLPKLMSGELRVPEAAEITENAV